VAGARAREAPARGAPAAVRRAEARSLAAPVNRAAAGAALAAPLPNVAHSSGFRTQFVMTVASAGLLDAVCHKKPAVALGKCVAVRPAVKAARRAPVALVLPAPIAAAQPALGSTIAVAVATTAALPLSCASTKSEAQVLAALFAHTRTPAALKGPACALSTKGLAATNFKAEAPDIACVTTGWIEANQ
jgi:hypothetical protein